MGWLSRQWRALTAIEKWLFLGWPVGVVLIGLGLLGDARDWWDTHPFLLETTGSLSAFLIGVPVLVVVVGRLETNLAERTLVMAQVRRAQATARQLTAFLLDAYLASTWPRIAHDEVKGKRLLKDPLDSHTAAALRMVQPTPAIDQTRLDFGPRTDVHDTMTALAAELEADVNWHDSSMLGLAELLWERDVPDLLGVGGPTLAAAADPARQAWNRIAGEPLLPSHVKDLSWESENRGEAVEELDKLSRFYLDVRTMLGFLRQILELEVAGRSAGHGALQGD